MELFCSYKWIGTGICFSNKFRKLIKIFFTQSEQCSTQSNIHGPNRIVGWIFVWIVIGVSVKDFTLQEVKINLVSHKSSLEKYK